MTQKLLCLCAVCALLVTFATTNVANAQEVALPPDCPCALKASPCQFNPCCPPVSYRVGLFGVVRPVYYAPVYQPGYYTLRYVRAPYVPYRPVVAPPYVW
jgi:hypothetical protein